MTYKYDDSGERVIKRGPQGETAYVSQFYTVRNREVGTKHVFAGGTRLVSKMVKLPKDLNNDGVEDPLANDCSEPWGWTNGNGQGLGHANGNGPCANNGNGNGNSGGGGAVYEKDQYFYHPDHLGSSSYVTDVDGEIFQHLEYFPFGETWVEESSNTQRTPYLFTGKELDEETGLYYFGARYYDPRTSVWQSPDPILKSHLADSEQFSELSFQLSLYSYSRLNPVAFADPDGNDYELLIGGPYGEHRYGHVALRVFGDGYDTTYDFGRYGETWGVGNSKGDGVLRVWANFNQYISGEKATGRTTTGFVYDQTPAEDQAAMKYFSELMDKAKSNEPGSRRRDFVEYVIQDDYHALEQNCTTICLFGIGAADEALGQALGNNAHSQGRGLSGLEKMLAGSAVGSQIFMPADLQAAAEAAKDHTSRNIYVNQPE